MPGKFWALSFECCEKQFLYLLQFCFINFNTNTVCAYRLECYLEVSIRIWYWKRSKFNWLRLCPDLLQLDSRTGPDMLFALYSVREQKNWAWPAASHCSGSGFGRTCVHSDRIVKLFEGFAGKAAECGVSVVLSYQ